MTELPQRCAGIRMSKRLPALEWVAVVLGVLTFMWGFLDWYGASDVGQNGYRLLDGYLPVGFALLAGLFALVNLRQIALNARRGWRSARRCLPWRSRSWPSPSSPR